MAIIKSSMKKPINKNGNIEKRHIINKIKNKELKYTFILVLIFMVIFAVIGYNSLIFDDDLLLNNYKSNDVHGVSTSSQIVSLTNDNLMSDKKGLLSYTYYINVENETSNSVNYRLNLVRDEDISTICGCGSKQLRPEQIKYSLNGKDVEVLTDDMLIKNITLNKRTNEVIKVRMWIDDTYASEFYQNDYHFHGHFVLDMVNV